MAPIRAHNKSRTGCKTCRRRKVKCDEDSPVCKNCVRRQIECVWGETQKSLSPSVNPMPSWPPPMSPSVRTLPAPTYMPTFPSIMASSALDIQGIELMHQYTSSTCYTFCQDASALDVWKIVIPRIAILPENSFLLHALLAISALHLNSQNLQHNLSLKYLCTAWKYFNEAISTIPSGEYSPIDGGAIFVAQLFIGIYGFSTSETMYTPSDWLRILRISASTFRTRLASLHNAAIAPLIPWITGPLDLNHPEDTCHPFPTSLSTLALPLYGSPDIEEIQDENVSATYRHAVCFLRRSWVASFYPDYHMHSAFFWLILSSDSYIRLLFERRPRALILFAHYCAIMRRIDGPWWTRRDWDAELMRVTSVLDHRWIGWLDWDSLSSRDIREADTFILDMHSTTNLSTTSV